MTTTPLPLVLVCALGGTIAMTSKEPNASVVPTESAQSLVDAVPEIAGLAQVEAISFRQIPGAHLTLEDAVELVQLLRTKEQYDGFVVTQGTDTLEETAYVVDLLWDRPAPVVVTGAMRNPTVPGSDGPANLLAATAVAGSAVTRSAGCLVVLGDEIHAASLVQKAHTSRPSAFESPGAGPIGIVCEGRPTIWADARRRSVPLPPPGPLPSVGIVRMAMGDGATMLTAAAGAGYDGLVVEAFGGGHLSEPAAAVAAELAQRVPVVLASRTGAGPVLASTYGFPGSETDLRSRGLIGAGTLDGLKARILLTLLLAGGADEAGVRAAFGA